MIIDSEDRRTIRLDIAETFGNSLILVQIDDVSVSRIVSYEIRPVTVKADQTEKGGKQV